MSVQAMSWAFKQDLPARPKVVLLALANRADYETGRCWPGLELLSKESSVPRRSLIRHIEALVRNGYVRKVKSKDDIGQQKNNVYFVCLDRDPVQWGEWHWYSLRDEDEPGAMVAPGAENDEDSLTTEAAKENSDPPSATVAPGQNPGAGCHGGHEPGANGGTRYNSHLNPHSPLTPRSVGQGTSGGFSRAAQDAEIEAEAVRGQAGKQGAKVFVIKGTRAWDAHCAYRKRTTGIGSMPTTWATIEGRRREGWWCDRLFPESSTDPPIAMLSAEDERELVEHGL